MGSRTTRLVALAITAFSLCIAVSPAGATANRPATAMSTLEQGVLADINAFRAQNHLAQLRLSAPLTASARAHTRQMAAAGYFAHESADGSAFWRRIQVFYTSSPWRYWSVGENLLWSSPDVDASGALTMWWNSPEHRKNMLTARWREIGLSAVHVPAAPGTYDGREVTIVTTDFGVRN